MKPGVASRRRRSPSGRRSFLLRAVVSLVVLGAAALLLADAGWWFRAQGVLDRGVREVLASTAGTGWHASARTGRRGGWPWSATLVLHDPVIENRAGLRWSGESMVAELSPVRRGMVVLDASGVQALRIPVPGRPPLPLRAWGSRISAEWPERDPTRFSWHADALHLAVGGSGPDDTIGAAAVAGALRPASGGIRLTVFLRDLALPALLGRSGGRVLPSTRLSILFPDLPDAAGFPFRGEWRSRGGRVVIEDIAMDWDGTSASLAGHVAVGADGYASGAFSLSTRAPDVILERLRDAGLIASGQAISMRAVLDVIRAGETGGAADHDEPVRLALTLDHGLLRLGRIPLLRLPALPAEP